ACSMYPGDQDFLDNVKKEAIDNVKRLRNHPCIALWCGNNEIETAWGEYLEHAGWGWKQQYSAEQRKTIWNDYEKVFHQILPDVIKTYTHGDFYWKSSPTAGDKMLATYESRSGDMHYWGVWHGKHPFTDFDTYVGRFMSEYGFQSFPLLSSVKKYTTIDDWDIESEVMASHQRSGIGNLRIKEYMSDGYQVPNDFEQFLYVGQVLQADGIRYAIEAHRKNMPYCMGSLYWQLNDCWPVASWSSIDYYGKWKALQYTAKEAFKNQIISIWTEGDTINIYGISDLEIDQDAILQVELIDYSGKAQWKEEIKFILKGNNSTLIYSKRKGDLLFGNNPDQMILAAHLISQGDTLDRALFDFVLPKHLKLKPPSIDLTWNANQLSVSTDTYVKGLYLDILGWEGRFSDNFFDLIPTEPKILHWSGALDDRQRDALKYLHLQQTTMNE
ncbi:MAG: hypothetical protein KDC53_14865, partial [Saprospiraceae bacterium]|nr:hypothetical protein [Saprospiraceae bacterium]